MEQTKTITTKGIEELDNQDIEWLREFLKPGQLHTLVKGLRELHKVRYGDLHLVITDGKVQSFKIVKSYR